MKKMTGILLLIGLLVMGTISPVALAAREISIFISMPEYADAIRELINEYKKVQPDVVVHYETTQSDYPTLLKVKLNSGDVPDIFASTTGKEIELYKEYSLNLADQPLAEAMEQAVKGSMADANGEGVYGLAIKGNYFGMVYNKGLFAELGVKLPETLPELETAVEQFNAAGIAPFSSGFGEWWVFKHAFQHFLAAATDDVQGLVQQFEQGQAKFKDYPELYENWFRFVDLVYANSDAKPLESTISTEIAALALGNAAMVVGQGPWIEADVKAIEPGISIGIAGYPVSGNAAQAQVIAGADQAMRISNSSDVEQDVLDFVNWWYTSDYGESWFIDLAKVVSPIVTDRMADFDLVRDGAMQVSERGPAPIGIIYSTDSFHMSFGEIMQAYLGGQLTKDEACAQIEQQWMEIDG